MRFKKQETLISLVHWVGDEGEHLEDINVTHVPVDKLRAAMLDLAEQLGGVRHESL